MAEVRRTQIQKVIFKVFKGPCTTFEVDPLSKIDPVLYKKIENDFLVGN